MQGNWENWRNSFLWSANREFFLSENDFKRSSEIQKFSRENVDIFWWSANRDKICKVFRESEKVENRCSTGNDAVVLSPTIFQNLNLRLIWSFMNRAFRTSNFYPGVAGRHYQRRSIK